MSTDDEKTVVISPHFPANLPALPIEEIEESEFKKINRRGFVGWLVGLGLGALGFELIDRAEMERELQWPLRKVTEIGDSFWKANFAESHQAPDRGPQKGNVRLNGDVGMNETVNGETWRMKIMTPEMREPNLISMAEIKELPSVTESFEFKCIEGWSEDRTCKGVRFSDFMQALNLGQKPDDGGSYGYVGMTSLNGGYYVSMDMKSLLHPQTLLCYEMNGKELPVENGFPLRLITPVKYGVKNIKQIGTIAFSDSPTADYWAENGYGDYLGL
jgi:DMSO/TMAO reductase YedYZ molybdopterin-dependent catalytic subunit